jgi:hypothetical protein
MRVRAERRSLRLMGESGSHGSSEVRERERERERERVE